MASSRLRYLLRAFGQAGRILEENRPLSAPRLQVIAVTPALREHDLANAASLTEAVAEALRQRGITTGWPAWLLPPAGPPSTTRRKPGYGLSAMTARRVMTLRVPPVGRSRRSPAKLWTVIAVAAMAVTTKPPPTPVLVDRPTGDRRRGGRAGRTGKAEPGERLRQDGPVDRRLGEYGEEDEQGWDRGTRQHHDRAEP